jgi:orotidine-5'-phosphate decarboxylase
MRPRVGELSALKPRERLIVALDAPDVGEARGLVERIGDGATIYKIGMELAYAGGLKLAPELASAGKQVFLDLKLHDIPNTIGKAVESLGPLPIRMLTLHCSGGGEMMRTAVAAQQKTNPDLLLLGVTVLTSMDAAGLVETGVTAAPAEQVARLGRLAAESGMRGLVCSPLEVGLLRRTLTADVQLITPGIRPAGGSDDQKRVMSPAEAARAGSTFIVVGRPILQAADPAGAARDILTDLSSA